LKNTNRIHTQGSQRIVKILEISSSKLAVKFTVMQDPVSHNTGSFVAITPFSNFMFCYRASLFNLVNKANLVHSFSYNVYFFSLHVSGDYVPIIRRNKCIYATTLGTCYSVCMTVWNAYRMMLGT